MKIYKIYAQGCIKANPVKDITYEAKEYITEAIEERYNNACDGGEIEIDIDASDEVFEEVYNKYYEEQLKDFDTYGILNCGDYCITRLEDDEIPKRPSCCGW